MTTAHTPGPWATYRLSPDSDPRERLIVISDDGETEISGVIHSEADARLIAAAPELLEALETILANGSMHDGTFVVNQGNGIEDAYAAIAKAKGGNL